MKIHSIISNTISEEILNSGHLSIRLMADGFSLLLEDRSYKPVVLIRAKEEQAISLPACISACEDWLNRHTLLEKFTGETTILPGSLSETLIPEELYTTDDTVHYLSSISELNPADSILHKTVMNRPFVILYAVSELVSNFSEKFPGHTRILSDTEVLLSVADQVNAADHQRGFALLEAQEKSLRIILIWKDTVQLMNLLEISGPDTLVYHTLNTLKQLGFDRKQSPLFYSGMLQEEGIET